MLLLRSAMRQPRNGNLNYSHKNAPRLWRRCIANTRIVKAFHTECLITIISVTLFPSNKFPRLLAEREIIANALFYQRCLGKGQAQSERKITNKYRHTPTFHHKTSKNFLPDCSLSGCFGYFCIDNVKKRQRTCFSLNYSATGSPRLAATSS